MEGVALLSEFDCRVFFFLSDDVCNLDTVLGCSTVRVCVLEWLCGLWVGALMGSQRDDLSDA